MNDLERAREKRKQRDWETKTNREDDVTLWMWVGEGDVRVQAVQFSVRDRNNTPIYTNRQRADIMFDALWQSCSEDPAESDDNYRICYAVYLDMDGRTWTRRSERLFEGNVGWPHAKWLLKRAWDVAKPLLRGALVIALKRHRNRWPLRRWKWLHNHYTD
jgi:hypothetical protein